MLLLADSEFDGSRLSGGKSVLGTGGGIGEAGD
jgi:hypothetical protein